MKRIFLLAAICLLIVMNHITYGQAGTLDSTFGTNGKYMTVPDTISYTSGSFALQTDEKIIVGSSKADWFATRFLPDGGVDSSFGTNGVSSFIPIPGYSELLRFVAVQPDNKVLMGGSYIQASKTSFLIARLNADGTVDSAFGNNGYQVIPITVAGDDDANVITVLSDNKILIGGRAGTSPSSSALVRLNPDGSLDTGFGTNGIVVIDDLGFFNYIFDMKVQSDGKIVTNLLRIDGAPTPFTIMRLNADGTKDNSFGSSGLVQITFNNHAHNYCLALQADNKIIVAGRYTDPVTLGKQQVAMVRLNTNGSLDNTFGVGGKVLTNVPFSVDFIVRPTVQNTDGKILVFTTVKHSSSGKWNLLTLRYLNNGSLDNEWGGTGYIKDSFVTNKTHYSGNIFYTNSGKVLITGFYAQGGPTYAAVMARYNSCSMSITGQPANMTRSEGSSATFTVTGSSPSAVYQWQTETTSGWENLVNGGQYSGVNTASLTISNLTPANNNQLFRSIGISGVCTDTSAAAVLTVTPPTGIENTTLSSAIQIYPNPVESQLVIEGKPDEVRFVSIKVSDVLGREIQQIETNGSSRVVLSTSKWPAGNYFIQIQSTAGQFQTFRVSKR